jgi:hypothetical protein
LFFASLLLKHASRLRSCPDQLTNREVYDAEKLISGVQDELDGEMDNLSNLKAEGFPRLFNLHSALLMYSRQPKVAERRRQMSNLKLRADGQDETVASANVAKPRKSAMKRSSMLPMQPPSMAEY